MSKAIALSGGVALLVAASGTAFGASSFVPTNNSVATRASLGVGTSLVPLDLTGEAYLNGTINFGNNGYTQTYTGFGGNFSGTLTVEVFGNVSNPGAGLNDLLMVYSFQGDGNQANGAETFDFGVDTSIQVDFAALMAATHGRIDAETALTGGQVDPDVTLFDNDFSNDTWFFDYTNSGAVSGADAELGGGPAETYSWYVRTTGDVKLNFVDVNITDFGTVKIRSMALVNNPGQPNLPTPGGVALLLSGVGAMSLRRRRK